MAVLLAAYNGIGRIEEQIESILSQDAVEIDLFISLDNSSDGSFEYLSAIAENNSQVHLLEYGPKFGSASANFFRLIREVDVSCFEYVCFSDQDDLWFSDKVSFAIDKLVESGCNGFSSSVQAYWPETGEKKLIVKSDPQTPNDHWFESPGPGCSQVFTASSFLKFQQFILDNSVAIRGVDYHDWLSYAYYRHYNLGWYISSVPKMFYVQHSKNQIGANAGLAATKRRLSMISSKWLRSQVNLIYRLVSGVSEDLVSFRFIIRNISSLRRKRRHSFVLFVLFILKVF